jgi:Skp family chaperone for outer membrane proteins
MTSRRIAVMGAALALLALPVRAQEAKIGDFEFSRVEAETDEGQRIQKSLKDFQESKQAALADKEKELKALNDQLTAQALSLSPERRSAMEKDLQKKQNDLQTAREGAQREWQIEFNEAQSAFQEKVINTVEAMGREGKYMLILERDQCVFAGETADITPLIITRLNAMSGGAPAAAAPAPKPAAPPKPTPPAPSKPPGR